jgi:hypothetical protein
MMGGSSVAVSCGEGGPMEVGRLPASYRARAAPGNRGGVVLVRMTA